RLAAVRLDCVHSVPPRPSSASKYIRSTYWPREHAGATGFSLSETSPFSPTVPSWCHARLRSRACHTQALTTHAIATPPLSPREWYRQRKVGKETQMAETSAKKAAAKEPAKKAAAKAPAKKFAAKGSATPNVTPETPNFTPDVEAAAERIKATSERVLELCKENGLIWLEAYEKMLDGVLKLEEDTAKGLGSDWVEKLVSTQADFIRDTLRAYLSALKDRLK